MVRYVFASAILLSVAACDAGGSQDDTDPPTDSDPQGDTDTTLGDTDVPSVTFAEVQTQAFASCGGFGPQGCHSRAPFAGDLDLMSADAYDQLVDAPAAIGGVRVKPGSLDESVLWLKLNNLLPEDGSLGEPMPKGEAIQWSAIAEEDMALVRAWILEGAPR